jgi:hypothetical protein
VRVSIWGAGAEQAFTPQESHAAAEPQAAASQPQELQDEASQPQLEAHPQPDDFLNKPAEAG